MIEVHNVDLGYARKIEISVEGKTLDIIDELAKITIAVLERTSKNAGLDIQNAIISFGQGLIIYGMKKGGDDE